MTRCKKKSIPSKKNIKPKDSHSWLKSLRPFQVKNSIKVSMLITSLSNPSISTKPNQKLWEIIGVKFSNHVVLLETKKISNYLKNLQLSDANWLMLIPNTSNLSSNWKITTSSETALKSKFQEVLQEVTSLKNWLFLPRENYLIKTHFSDFWLEKKVMIKSSQTLVTIYTELTSAQHISTSMTQLMMLKTKMKKKKTNKTKMMMKILKKMVKTSKQSKNKKEAQSLKSQNANNNDLKVSHCWFLYLFITCQIILFYF